MKAKPATVYAKASVQIWDLVRAAYLSGLSAPSVAARFGVSVTALRKRARREGWTKAAYADALLHKDLAGRAPAAGPGAGVAEGLDVFDRALPSFYVEPAGLARRALEQAAQALATGRPHDAAGYARAAAAIANLDELIPPFREDGAPEQVARRQSTLRDAVFEMAQTIAGRMLDGAEPPAGYDAAVAAWRREHGRREQGR